MYSIDGEGWLRISGTHIECMASWMSCIQVLRSSRELAWTSTISGFAMPAVMRKRPRSSWATSRTISFCREITVARWSCWWEKRQTQNEEGGVKENGHAEREIREMERGKERRREKQSKKNWNHLMHTFYTGNKLQSSIVLCLLIWTNI